MSVLINGFRIPTENDPKTFLLHFHDDGTAEIVALGYPQIRYGVVIVPTPHGRLIDASEKIKVQIYDDQYEEYHLEEMTIDDLLSSGWIEADAPTVIPASEEKT